MHPQVSLPMSSDTVGYYLTDGPRSGPENMTCDQLMLEQAAATNRPLIRFYTWMHPTLSLGYFQKYADRQRHEPSHEIAVIRRATGGGAIVHHYDWTYAVAVPTMLLGTATQNQASLGASQQLYDTVHRSVVAWLRDSGWDARMWDAKCQVATSPGFGCSFLCFERRSPGDIVVGESKVMGSAQRRVAGAILQHGSLLLQSSPHAPSLAGLREMSGSVEAGEAYHQHSHEHDLHTSTGFRQSVVAAMIQLLNVEMREVSSLDDLLAKADLETDKRFFTPKWTLRL